MSLERLLAVQEREVRGLALRSLRRLRPIWEEAGRELRRELGEWEGRGEGSLYSAAKRREALLRVESVLDVARERLGDELAEGAAAAREQAMGHLREQVRMAGSEFGEARGMDVGGVDRMSRELLLERSRRLADNWSARGVEQTRRILGLGLAKGASLEEMVRDLTGAGGPLAGQRHAAQRLVRTELTHHYNQRTLEGMREGVAEAEKAGRPAPKKRLVHVIDSRTAPDSFAIMAHRDNQVKEVDEAFFDPMTGSEFQAPPNRPNDRARVVFFFGTAREEEGMARERRAAEEEEKKRAEGGVKGGRRAEELRERREGRRRDGDVAWSRVEDRGVERASVRGSVGTEGQKRTLADLERRMRTARKEHAYGVDPTGRVRAFGVGDERSVRLRGQLPEGSIVTHNHPSGGGFSVRDWLTAHEGEAREVRVVGLEDGRAVTHVMRPGRFPAPEDRAALARIEVELEQRLLTEKGFTARDYSQELQSRAARLLGAHYERFED